MNAKESGKAITIYIDQKKKDTFKMLLEAYDQGLSQAWALEKLIDYAIENWWLPGYIKREKIMSNKEGSMGVTPRLPKRVLDNKPR